MLQYSREYHIMEARRNAPIAPSIRVKDMQKSLDFYTKTLGFRQPTSLLAGMRGIAHASVGFDSPLLMLSPIEYVRTSQTKEDLAKNKLGVGVQFYIGMNGNKKLDAFFSEVKAKGVAVVKEPKTESWGDRIFTVRDPDGYALTFSEYVKETTPEARLTAFESAHQK
jgi:uncharacterized glyoxalase superfamily protein PhnB